MKRNHSRFFRRLGCALLAAALLCLTAAPALAAEAPQVLRVAFPEVEGYSMTSPDGNRSGLVVDFLNEIAKYTGWKYEYVPVDQDELLVAFGEGRFDLMGGQYYLESLESQYGYPIYNCGYTKLLLLARQNNRNIHSYNLDTFNGKTIGVFEGAAENIRRLQIYLDLNNLNCTLKRYAYDDVVAEGGLTRFLQSGEIDLLLVSSAPESNEYYVAASFDSRPHYLVARPDDQKTIDGLNMALSRIFEATPSFAEEAYARHFTSMVNTGVCLTDEELAWVKQTGSVTVAVPYDFHPMICLNNTDEHDGVLPEVLSHISEYSGLSFTYVYYDSYAAALEAVRNGETDLLGFCLASEESAADLDLALSAPYIELNHIMVRNKNVSFPAEGLTGALLNGRYLPDDIAVSEIFYYMDTNTALADVNSGKVDFFYGISSRVERIIQRNNFTNLVQVNLVNNSMEIGLAMRRPVNPVLLAVINKGINSLSADERALINGRNLVSIGETTVTLANLVYAYPAIAIAVVASFLTILLVAVIIVGRNRVRAAAMRGELSRAEADSRAKGEFLSRMSHEIRTPMNAIVGLADLAEMAEGVPDGVREKLGKIKSSSKYLLGLINDILDMSRIESGKMEIAQEAFSLGALLGDIKSMLNQEAAVHGLVFVLEQEITHDRLIGDAIRVRQVMINLLSNAFKFTGPGGRVLATIHEDTSTENAATFTFRVKDTGVGIAPENQQRIFGSFEQLGSNLAKSRGTGLGLAISQSIVRLMGGELQLKSTVGKGSEFYFTITLAKDLAPAQAEPAGEDDKPLLNGLVLLAEDNDLNAEIAMELLSTQGVKVRRAENGRIAVDIIKHSRLNEFDLVLMDVMMPEMNGLEATQAIRALNRPDAKTIPIIAMTANAFQEDKNAAFAAGMNGFLPKPIDVALLFQELQNVLNK